MLVVYLRVLFIRFLARDEWSRLQVHLMKHLDVRLLTLEVVLFSIIYVVLLLVLISVPLTLIILLTVVILIIITVHLLPHEKLLRLMLLVVLLLLHIQLLLLLLLHKVEIFCLFRVNVHLLINFATLNRKAIGELIGRDWYLNGIFSLVLLRNLISEFVSEDLVLGLSKNLLVSALLGEFFIDLSLLLRQNLGFWLVLT